MQAADSSYASVRGLTRGLIVLRALNAQLSGRATTRELSELTGLHRTTVRRLIETLLAEGLVRRSESDDSYRLTIGVRALSEGYTDDEWIATLAPPIMIELMQKVIWPSDLTTPDGEGMIIRETTHRFSPLSFHRAMVGRRLPMLSSSVGRAYFGHCSEERRASILDILRAGVGGSAEAALAHDERYVDNLVRRVRADGFGFNDGDLDGHKKTGAIAVPVWHRGEVLAAINIVYLSRAITPADAAKRYLGDLSDAAERISRSLDQGALAQRNQYRADMAAGALRTPAPGEMAAHMAPAINAH